MTRRGILRVAIRAAFPLAGIVVVGNGFLRSIGGDIRPLQFALGVALILGVFLGDLVPDDPKPPARRRSG